MERIRLPRGVWFYDPQKPLGPEGGFGIVYSGSAEGYENLAIKKIKLEAYEAAYRELKIAKELTNKDFSHVIQVFDAGEDTETGFYFVIMACAEKSLDDVIKKELTFDDLTSASIMLEIVEGLLEVKNIVHRDLKPANILYHEKKWKIADFGIAKFVEDSTSRRTLKGCLTPEYAAPEQWRLERSTNATDIYALGCIGFELLTGSPPFNASTTEDLQYQHLYSNPPKLDRHNPVLRSSLSMMLRKIPETRPSCIRIKALLTNIIQNKNQVKSKKGLDSLALAGAIEAERELEEKAIIEKKLANEKYRNLLAQNALENLREIIRELFNQIINAVPTAKIENSNRIILRNARLEIFFPSTIEALPANISTYSEWEFVAKAKIQVMQFDPIYIWSSSLWYSKLYSEAEYRWREVSYFASGLCGSSPSYEPFALDEVKEADLAASPNITSFKIAYGPQPIDDENIDDFCNRWAVLFARAVQKQLRHPRNLPLSRNFYKD